MKEIFVKLQELQNILSSKYQLENELEDIPRALKMKEEILSQQKKQFISLNESYDVNQQDIAQLRSDFTDIEKLRQEAEQRMDKIKTQREYEALNKEISEYSSQELALHRKLQSLENKGQELSEQLQSEGDSLNLQEAEISDEKLRIKILLREKQDGISALEEEEENLAPGMDPEMLYKFDRILRSKGGEGLFLFRKVFVAAVL